MTLVENIRESRSVVSRRSTKLSSLASSVETSFSPNGQSPPNSALYSKDRKMAKISQFNKCTNNNAQLTSESYQLMHVESHIERLTIQPSTRMIMHIIKQP